MTSPTMIVDEYCREPFTPSSPNSYSGRVPSLARRTFSRGRRQASGDDAPRETLGLFKLRKSSRGASAQHDAHLPLTSTLASSERTTVPEERQLLP